MNTMLFQRVYLKAAATACGPIEAQGPLAGCFDVTHDDIYCGEKSYELAERRLLSDAYDSAMKKAGMSPEQLDLCCGGDLLNQLGTSHYFVRDIPVSFLGLYGACSNSTLSAMVASVFVEYGLAKQALAFTSSHNATAERQFRYPNEYGVQKPPTTTFTATGAGAMIFTHEKQKIQCTQGTLGRVIDFEFTNPNDMGSAMAPAAFDTIKAHFDNTHTSFEDYDLVVTGDLSTIGNEILIDMFKYEGMDPKGKLVDCGCILYDREKQDVFAGGSGCACSSLVTIAYLFDRLRNNHFHKIMVVATGALLTPILIQQKESIPCVVHALVYESGVEE